MRFAGTPEDPESQNHFIGKQLVSGDDTL